MMIVFIVHLPAVKEDSERSRSRTWNIERIREVKSRQVIQYNGTYKDQSFCPL